MNLLCQGTPVGFKASQPVPPRVAGRWGDAGDLQPGDVLLSRTGPATVESVETEHVPTTVYHIYVEDLHNYAVGDGEWLVHNGHRTREPNGRYAYDGGPVGGEGRKGKAEKGSGLNGTVAALDFDCLRGDWSGATGIMRL